MHTRRLVGFLLGMWMAGSLAMLFVASQSFRSVDRILEAPLPQVTQSIETLGKENVRLLLRYQAAEQNRHYFERWGAAQLVLGTALFLVVLFATSEKRWMLLLPMLMLILSGVMNWVVIPDIVTLGRSIDFVVPYEELQARQRFARLHNAYLAMDAVKLGLGVSLLFVLVVGSRRRSSSARKQVDAVNHADHGHVNG